jgi:hypothetical protein
VGGRTRWHPHYDSAIYVDWFGEKGVAGEPGLTIGFGGRDTVQTGYVLYPREGGQASFGKVVVTRVSCRPRRAP